MLATGSFTRALALAAWVALLASPSAAQEPAAPAPAPEAPAAAPAGEPAPPAPPAEPPAAPAALERGQDTTAAPRPAPAPRRAAVPADTAAAPRAGAADTAATPSAAPADTGAATPGQQPAAPTGARSEADSLLARARERFDVYPLRDGALLLPKYEAPSVQSVQIAGGTVAINGRPASGAEIDSLLGEDAPVVLRLSYLDAAALASTTAAAAGPGAVGAAVPGEPEQPEPPEFPEPPISDVVRIGSSVEVESGETVTGDVVSVGGDVDVDGTVLGDVVSIGGVLRLREGARVMGDAVSVGGRLERDPGAEVMGQVSVVGWSFPYVLERSWMWDGGGMFGALGGLLVSLFWIALLLLLGALFVLFAERPLDRVETNLRSSPWKAGLVGFLAQVLFLPAYVIGLVLLVITIIGIPVAVIWAFGFFIVGFVALLFGFIAVARAAGHSFSNRFDRPLSSSYIAILVGLLALFTPTLIGDLFAFGPGFMDLFSVLFHVLGFIILYVAATIGFGAVILTRFGTRTTWSGEPPAAAVPPPPYAPGPAPAPAGAGAPASSLEGPRGLVETGEPGLPPAPHAGEPPPSRNDPLLPG